MHRSCSIYAQLVLRSLWNLWVSVCGMQLSAELTNTESQHSAHVCVDLKLMQVYKNWCVTWPPFVRFRDENWGRYRVGLSSVRTICPELIYSSGANDICFVALGYIGNYPLSICCKRCRHLWNIELSIVYETYRFWGVINSPFALKWKLTSSTGPMG